MKMRLACLFLILVWSGACASSNSPTVSDSEQAPVEQAQPEAKPEHAAGIVLSTPRTTFVRNDRIGLKLTNDTDTAVGYDLCYTRIEMEVEGQWHAVEDYPDYCGEELRVLEPGDSADYGLSMADVLPSGKYRVITEVEIPHGGKRETLATVDLRLED
ncbi:MAG: immunoglobulin-like domain-containing protein [Bradymonadaceae bacterium]